VTNAREVFLRRYATSPIHVPRLERLLSVYGDDAEGFAARFIEWDRDAPDLEAARIVAEILSAGDDMGRIVRLSDDAVRAAIRWMSTPSSCSVAERSSRLRDVLTRSDATEVAAAIAGLDANAA
jgi:hypothetical protein